MSRTITINVDALNTYLRQNAQKARDEAHAGAAEFEQDTGMSRQSFLGIPGTGDMEASDVIDNVCDLRPEIKRLLKVAAWVPVVNGIVARLKPYLEWTDREVLKPMCEAASKEKAAAKP